MNSIEPNHEGDFFKNRIFDKDQDSMNIVKSNPDGDISRKIGYFGKNQS